MNVVIKEGDSVYGLDLKTALKDVITGVTKKNEGSVGAHDETYEPTRTDFVKSTLNHMAAKDRNDLVAEIGSVKKPSTLEEALEFITPKGYRLFHKNVLKPSPGFDVSISKWHKGQWSTQADDMSKELKKQNKQLAIIPHKLANFPALYEPMDMSPVYEPMTDADLLEEERKKQFALRDKLKETETQKADLEAKLEDTEDKLEALNVNFEVIDDLLEEKMKEHAALGDKLKDTETQKANLEAKLKDTQDKLEASRKKIVRTKIASNNLLQYEKNMNRDLEGKYRAVLLEKRNLETHLQRMQTDQANRTITQEKLDEVESELQKLRDTNERLQRNLSESQDKRKALLHEADEEISKRRECLTRLLLLLVENCELRAALKTKE